MRWIKSIAITLVAVLGVANTLAYGGIIGDNHIDGVDPQDVNIANTPGDDTVVTPGKLPANTPEQNPVTSPESTPAKPPSAPVATPGEPPANTPEQNPVTSPESAPTDPPSANEAYRIVEIGGLIEIGTSAQARMYRFNRATAYNPAENILYYFADREERAVHAYDLSTNTSSVIITPEELKTAVLGEHDSGISNTPDNRSISIIGMAYNQYSGDVYIYGNHRSSSGRWFYSIAKQRVITYSSSIADNAQLYFVGNNEYLINSSTTSTVLDFDGNSSKANVHYIDGYIFEHREFFYYVNYVSENAYRISRIGSIYSPNTSTIADLTGIRGASYRDGYLYILLDDGIVYEIDIDNNSRAPYISPEDIAQTGRSFLGRNPIGLIMTNCGGYITYDASNQKLKYVVPN